MLEGIAAASQAGESHGAAGGTPLARQSGRRPRRPGYRDKARSLQAEVIATYRRIGMPKHVEMAEEMLAEAWAPPRQLLGSPVAKAPHWKAAPPLPQSRRRVIGRTVL